MYVQLLHLLSFLRISIQQHNYRHHGLAHFFNKFPAREEGNPAGISGVRGAENWAPASNPRSTRPRNDATRGLCGGGAGAKVGWPGFAKLASNRRQG